MMTSRNGNERIEIPITIGDEENLRPEFVEENQASVHKVSHEEEYRDQLQRLQAEFLNYKRRVEKEKDEIGSFARGNLIRAVLPVVDDLGRLIDHHGDDETVPVESVRLILQKFNKILADEGLETVESVDAEFDPESHEALDVKIVPEALDGKIIEEWQKGYRYKGRLLRPSRVKVGKFMPPRTDSTE
jgi:molecular chaperone GrpE